MCGIFFTSQHSGITPELIKRYETAVDMLAHRGPEERGVISLSPNIFCGHRRLSIIGLTDSQQPMLSPDKRYLLSYNGEVYNFRILREKLKDKWQFCTKGDTEVLLAGLICEGESFIAQLEGMWAFAFWDQQSERLLLSRDRIGQKPLYYSLSAQKKSITCCSELPALLYSLGEKPVVDDASLADFMRYGYCLPGFTFYREVYELPAGHNLLWHKETAPTIKRYWRITPGFGGYRFSQKKAAEELQVLLADAVSKRMIADVEVGSFLSGGVDSSLITSYANLFHPGTIKTFTIGFKQKSYDESLFAARVAEYIGTDHYLEQMEEFDVTALCELVFRHVGQPFADSSLLPTAMVSRLASRHVKVVLSGDGGDEFFSGYQHYQAMAVLRWYSRLPRILRKGVAALVSSIPESSRSHSRSLLKKAQLFVRAMDRMKYEQPYIAPMMFDPMEMSQLIPDIDKQGHGSEIFAEECDVKDIERMMFMDSMVYLPQDILCKVDRASMAYSVEARAPFLDHKLVEFAFSLPLAWHRNWYSGKLMLKNSFYSRLPAEIWQRRKQGFGVPLGDWFRGRLGDELRSINRQIDSPVKKDYVDNLLMEHAAKKRDNGQKLWRIYVYYKWNSLLDVQNR